YVATTRARDRLYLSSALKDGVLRPGPGSLADVLPASLKPIFASAAMAPDDTLSWTAASGRTFTWRVCRPPLEAAGTPPGRPQPAQLPRLPALTPSDRSVPRVSVTEWLHRRGAEDRFEASGSVDGVLVGVLVHRIFQAASLGLTETADVAGLAASLLRPDERSSSADPEAVVLTAAEIWNALASRDDVKRLLASAEVIAEVPFSLRVEDDGRMAILRGTIDGISISPDGSVTVVEFKTGQPRPVHQEQLDIYLRAARELFPGRTVEGLLVYQGKT
ncbi:MAG TPA: PD-(D/E)XK nuclease family protein, partial [Vicinamibacterales bacterium]|nr:PD-(D/E)XK nuclease family protein [Vicinamibacterales bacterium]